MLKASIIRYKNRKINTNYKCNINTKRCFINSKSPNYHYEYFGDNTPICCATSLYTILKDVVKVLEKNEIEYFASFGTLLGAIRHAGLIPWDTDLDILIAEDNKEKVISILKEKLPNHYELVEDKENIIGSVVRVNLSKINTLHLDIFTYISKGSKITFGYNREFKDSDIFPLQNIEFYDINLSAPKDINKQLTMFYGKDYMEYAYKQWALNKKKFKIKDFSPAKIEVV